MADEMETKPEPMTLYILRRRYRAALAYAAMDSGAWALAAGLTVQHLNAVLRGERPMTEELREKLETFIREQFRLMLEERGADNTTRRAAVILAVEKYLENNSHITLDASDERHRSLLARGIADEMDRIEREQLEEALGG